ncbi:GNAT family N-acetyltransferase [Lentzea nigeriaca]|uniref:GNAT family N-acetyltransferase n=1 Tax=Lentzea nigeriaca TaxID=1128665 RepID=UPI00195F0477|nr:GNAT family N-acetyltransferase [Lentzea nigeriaca]MBM7859360.1 GNAT superfamily N-acetyltransferase [Lentzea nigeriaca]
MGDIDVEELDFPSAAETDQRALFDLQVAWWSSAMPPRELPEFSGWVRRRLTLDAGWGLPRFAVARENGRIIGYADGYLPTTANTHLVTGTVVVDPRWQRQGIGTTLLRYALRLANRDTAEASWVPRGSEGERWATNRGFTVVTALTVQELVLTDSLPEVGEVPPGYRLAQWTGRAPEALLDAYVDALNATNDQPMGDSTIELVEYTREQVRQEEDDLSTAGVDVWVVLAMHGDEAAGVTVVYRTLSRPSVAHQRNTSVVPAHRGKGLGRLIKAQMLRQLTGIEIIETETNSTNEHMRRINHSLGYTDRLTTVSLSARVADLKL